MVRRSGPRAIRTSPTRSRSPEHLAANLEVFDFELTDDEDTIDHNGDNVSDFQIHTRFGQNALGDWGMQVSNLPGEAGPLVGPVETVNAGASAQAWAGLADDPFFFDLEGFETTLMTGALSFDPNRDSLAGVNVTSIVVEVPLSALGSTNLSLWATTGRK